MPILPPEPSFYPEALFNHEQGRSALRWTVLHTKPRQEKSLARYLHSQQLAFYLPLTEKRSRIRGKVVSSYLPLFPGYVFLASALGDLSRLVLDRQVVRPLEVRDQDRLWDDLGQIQSLIQTGLPVVPELALQPGQPIEIRDGPLKGLRGVILKSITGNRFVVKVDFIQRGASVILDDYLLERIAG